jgi:xanthine dehydrogenase large subunit
MKQDVSIRGGVHADLAHDSAVKHVTGRADYTDDIPEPAGTLHAALGLAEVAHGEIEAIDLEEVRAAPASSAC